VFGAVKQTVAQELCCQILPDWSLFSKAHHHTNKWFLLASACFFLVLLFQIIVCYDDNFINYDPPFQTSQSSIDLTYHQIRARLLKCFGEAIYLSVIVQIEFLGF
jgi:hypothetical protein